MQKQAIHLPPGRSSISFGHVPPGRSRVDFSLQKQALHLPPSRPKVGFSLGKEVLHPQPNRSSVGFSHIKLSKYSLDLPPGRSRVDS